MKILKLWNHLEWSRGRCNGLSDLVGEFRRGVAEESRSLLNVNDAVGFKPHQSRAGRIGSHWIIRKHDLSETTRRAVERPVSFHRHNAVRDHKVYRNSCAQIEDALLNAFPVKNVFRPSVSRTRH